MNDLGDGNEVISETEVVSRVNHARSIIRGNGALNIERNMLFLAANHFDLLQIITKQCGEYEEDRLFWAYQLCNPITSDGKRTSYEVREHALEVLRGFTLLLHDARRFLRVHRGNPEYAVQMHMREAVKRCKDGSLPQTPELLRASLMYGVVTADAEGNEDGRANDLLGFIADHLHEIEPLMSWITAEELSIGFLDSHLNRATHSTLATGWL